MKNPAPAFNRREKTMAICKNCPAAPKDSEAKVCKAGIRRLLVFHDG